MRDNVTHKMVSKMLTAALVFLKTAVLSKLLVIESISIKENRLKVVMVSICIKSKPSQKHCLILEPMYENQFQASQLRPTSGHCNEKINCTSIARAFKMKFNKGSIRNMETIILGLGKLV